MQQHPEDRGVPAQRAPHRYRTFMMEEILTEDRSRKCSSPSAGMLRFGVQAVLCGRPYRAHYVLKAERSAVYRFPPAPPHLYPFTPTLGSAIFPHTPTVQHMTLGPFTEGDNRAKKGRRSRTVFTEMQLMGLEKRFEKQKYLSTPDRIDLAASLGLSQLQVKTWYQNRRMKWKKIVLQGGASESPTKPKGRPKKSSAVSCSDERAEQDKDPQTDNSPKCKPTQEE